MRDLNVIQMDAARRARKQRALRDRIDADGERITITEKRLRHIEHCMKAYRLTEQGDAS